MTWNYRIILHDRGADLPWYGLHEVAYDGDHVVSWTENTQTFWCYREEGPAGIFAALTRALESVGRLPVLIESELEQQASARV